MVLEDSSNEEDAVSSDADTSDSTGMDEGVEDVDDVREREEEVEVDDIITVSSGMILCFFDCPDLTNPTDHETPVPAVRVTRAHTAPAEEPVEDVLSRSLDFINSPDYPWTAKAT